MHLIRSQLGGRAPRYDDVGEWPLVERRPWHLRVVAGGGLQALEHVVDAGRQRLDVGGLDRGEGADAQLVATELA